MIGVPKEIKPNLHIEHIQEHLFKVATIYELKIHVSENLLRDLISTTH